MTAFNRVEEWGNVDNHWVARNGGPAGPIVSESHTQVPFGTRTITAVGAETPHFTRRQKRGELLPLQPYSNTTHEVWGSWHWLSYRASDQDHYELGGSFVPSHIEWDLSELNPEFLIQSAAAKAYASGHDTLTFLAEFAKAKRMVAQLPGKILRLIRQKGGPRDLRELNRIWLEGRYGWRPLLLDLKELHGILMNLEDASRSRVSERTGATVEQSLSDSYEVTVRAPWATTVILGYYTVFRETRVTVSGRGCVVADFKPPIFQFNPAVTAWELVPFSFVLDWLIDVGTALEALSFQVLASKHYASFGTLLEATTTATIVSVRDADTNFRVKTGGGQGTRISLIKTREPRPVPYLPQMVARFDEFKLNDLIAILRELTRRK